MRHLDLFSGIGGFALAARWLGMETVGFCEIDPWARKVLQKNFPNVPIHNDVKTLRGNEYGKIEILTGGFPCQPYSTAGKRKGKRDPRALWPECRRVIGESKPDWLLLENVEGFVGLALDEVCADLEAKKYEVWPSIIPACGVGAWHQRKRAWVVANRNCGGRDSQSLPSSSSQKGDCSTHADCANAATRRENQWLVEPAVDRVVHGVSRKLDKRRIEGLGNAIVPQVAYEIMKAILFSHNVSDRRGA